MCSPVLQIASYVIPVCKLVAKDSSISHSHCQEVAMTPVKYNIKTLKMMLSLLMEGLDFC